jgi:alkylhydroperoxidase family enzyme
VPPRDPSDLAALAPEPFAAWTDVVGALRPTIGADRLAGLATSVSMLLGTLPSDLPVAGPAGGAPRFDEPTQAFVDQFVLDVSAMSDDQRGAALAALGADAFPFVQALYVVDLGTRVGAAWRQLLGVGRPPLGTAGDVDLWTALETFMRAVARLDALDPVTTEIVRLRGARTHDCRLCRSLRNVRAAEAGTGEDTYDQIDDYERSALPERHQVALRLVDAIVWQPAAYSDDLVAAVAREFSPTETVELVLDVARNAANKIAVAFRADDPHVTKGVEFYDVDATGELVYGLTPRG